MTTKSVVRTDRQQRCGAHGLRAERKGKPLVCPPWPTASPVPPANILLKKDFATHLAIDASGIQRSDASLRPIMPATIKVRHVTRTGSAGSPNSTIPMMTVPAAPIPVHIA
jgi:hypothetical protein